MNMINSVILEGRICEIKAFNDRNVVIIESDRNVKNSEGIIEIVSEKFTCEVFGGLKEIVLTHVKTHNKIMRVVGRLSERIWKDLEGENHSTTVIVVEHLEVKN